MYIFIFFRFITYNNWEFIYLSINFKVTLKNDITLLNIIDLALNDSSLITKYGKIENSCNKIMDPITFSSPNSYIPIYEWNEFPKFNSFSIEFQTIFQASAKQFQAKAKQFQAYARKL